MSELILPGSPEYTEPLSPPEILQPVKIYQGDLTGRIETRYRSPDEAETASRGRTGPMRYGQIAG